MEVPVDGIVIKSSGVLSNESAMTGESDEVKKDTMEMCRQRQEDLEQEDQFSNDVKKNHGPHDIPSPIILSGTQISTGEGWFLCLVVGKYSCNGKIRAKLEQNSDEMTPLQEKLETVGQDLGRLGMYCALFTIHVLFLRFFIERFISREFDLFGGEPSSATKDSGIKNYVVEWLKYFIVGIAIIVVAVPEGLPLAVMITLAYSVRKMLKD